MAVDEVWNLVKLWLLGEACYENEEFCIQTDQLCRKTSASWSS